MAKSNRKPEPIPLCPLAGFSPCHRQHCALWDDDWKLCSLNYGSVYSSVRAAACDAAVEVVREYVGEREQGALSALRGTSPGSVDPFSLKTAHCAVFRALESTAVGKQENALSQSKADNSIGDKTFWGTEADGA